MQYHQNPCIAALVFILILFIVSIQILSSESQHFSLQSPELSFHKQEMPIKPGQLQQEQKNTSQVSSAYEKNCIIQRYHLFLSFSIVLIPSLFCLSTIKKQKE